MPSASFPINQCRRSERPYHSRRRVPRRPVEAGLGGSRFGCLGEGRGTRPQLRLDAGTTTRLSVTSSSPSAASPSLPPGSALIRRQVHDDFPTTGRSLAAVTTPRFLYPPENAKRFWPGSRLRSVDLKPTLTAHLR